MMDSLFSTHKSKDYTLAGKKVIITWKVPTPIDMTEIALKGDRYIDFFKNFVTNIDSEIAELREAFPADVIRIPGTWGLITNVAKDIVLSSVIGEEEKN